MAKNNREVLKFRVNGYRVTKISTGKNPTYVFGCGAIRLTKAQIKEYFDTEIAEKEKDKLERAIEIKEERIYVTQEKKRDKQSIPINDKINRIYEEYAAKHRALREEYEKVIKPFKTQGEQIRKAIITEQNTLLEPLRAERTRLDTLYPTPQRFYNLRKRIGSNGLSSIGRKNMQNEIGYTPKVVKPIIKQKTAKAKKRK